MPGDRVVKVQMLSETVDAAGKVEHNERVRRGAKGRSGGGADTALGSLVFATASHLLEVAVAPGEMAAFVRELSRSYELPNKPKVRNAGGTRKQLLRC